MGHCHSQHWKEMQDTIYNQSRYRTGTKAQPVDAIVSATSKHWCRLKESCIQTWNSSYHKTRWVERHTCYEGFDEPYEAAHWSYREPPCVRVPTGSYRPTGMQKLCEEDVECSTFCCRWQRWTWCTARGLEFGPRHPHQNKGDGTWYGTRLNTTLNIVICPGIFCYRRLSRTLAGLLICSEEFSSQSLISYKIASPSPPRGCQLPSKPSATGMPSRPM